MTKLQKILFIIPSLGGGGAEKVLVDLLDNFDYSRYAVSLLVIHLLNKKKTKKMGILWFPILLDLPVLIKCCLFLGILNSRYWQKDIKRSFLKKC